MTAWTARSWIFRPQLASLSPSPPSGSQWLHELKLDGYRLACVREGRTVRLLTRNGNDWTSQFPEVVKAALELTVSNVVLDGEVVIQRPDGRTDFQALQNAIARKPPRKGLVYFAFDLLRLNDEDIAAKPVERRKQLLEALLADEDTQRIRYSAHVIGEGAAVFAEACRLQAEGIVSKRLRQPYRPGRSSGWLKTRCVLRQEFVIGGFTDPEGSREAIGALLVGAFGDDGKLAFTGKVGTGFDHRTARMLRSKLEPLEQRACPFTPRPEGWLGKHGHWVRPTMVAEVQFSEWTRDRKIRHPSFQGLRAGGPPAETCAQTVEEERACDERSRGGSGDFAQSPDARALDGPRLHEAGARAVP